MRLTMATGELDIFEIGMDQSQEELAVKRARIKAVLSSVGDSLAGMSLYDYIGDPFKMQNIDSKDLSVPMRDTKTQKSRRVSICDMLYYSTTVDCVPTLESIALFISIRRQYTIPFIYIKNAAFKKAVEEAYA